MTFCPISRLTRQERGTHRHRILGYLLSKCLSAPFHAINFNTQRGVNRGAQVVMNSIKTFNKFLLKCPENFLFLKNWNNPEIDSKKIRKRNKAASDSTNFHALCEVKQYHQTIIYPKCRITGQKAQRPL